MVPKRNQRGMSLSRRTAENQKESCKEHRPELQISCGQNQKRELLRNIGFKGLQMEFRVLCRTSMIKSYVKPRKEVK